VLPLIDSALTRHYGLARNEAVEIESCLYEWFHGFVRRPGSPKSEALLKPHLIMMTCQAAHVYWSGKVSNETPGDENVRRSLTLGPQQIAIELEQSGHRRETPPDREEPRNG
jgi:hypothetical protein